jgi:TPR repeat protein
MNVRRTSIIIICLSLLSLQLCASQALSKPEAPAQQESEKRIQALKFFQAALKHKADGDYADAFRALEQAFELDPSNASYQNDLGFYYSKGIGVPKNQVKAVELFQKAAEQNYPAALSNLGSCYEHGLGGLTQDAESAIKHYEAAAKLGYTEAEHNIGFMYGSGELVEKDYAKAVEHYRIAAGKNYPQAERNLAYCYERGFGVPKSFDEAVKLYTRAAEHGDNESKEFLGDLYKENGDFQKALFWYQKAHESGIKVSSAIALCQRKLSPQRSISKLASSSSSSSRSNSSKSALLAPALSLISLGARPLVPTSPQSLPSSNGLMALPSQPMSPESSSSSLSRSSSAPAVAPAEHIAPNSPQAQQLLVSIPQKPLAATRSVSSIPAVQVIAPAPQESAPQVALDNEKIAAAFSQELFEMGRNHYDGSNNTPRDLAVAILYWQMAAEQGNSNALYKLGCCYRDGIGVAADTNAAVQCFIKAADKQLTEAEYDLAVLYEQSNLSNAIDLYIRAANKNHPGAEYKLGLFYEKGISHANTRIESNVTTAIGWYRKAGTHGFSEAEVQSALKRCSEK